jgi:PPIC-type PPIASE domain
MNFCFQFRSAPPRLILIARGLLLLLLALASAARADEPVMTVNQTPVSQAEFIFFMEQERPAVFQFFYEHHRLADGTNFWNQVRGKTTPRLMLQQNTIRRLVREKVEQKVFLDLGLATNISYAALLDRLAVVNQDRQSANARHQVLYGPITYNLQMFYENWKSNLRLRAKEKLATTQMAITEHDLKHFYQSNSRLFQSPEKWSLEIFNLDQNSSSAEMINSPGIAAVAKNIFQQIKTGQSAAQILETFGKTNSVKLTHEQFDDLTRDRLGELFSDDKIFQQVIGLKKGRCAQLSRSGGHVQIVRYNTKTPASVLPFEQVAELVRRRYVDEHYDQWIAALTKSAKVTFDQRALDALLP